MTAQKDTRILRLFREYHDYKSSNPLDPDAPEEEHESYFAHLEAIEAQVMALPCTCAADFAAKSILDTCQGGLMTDWKRGELWKEARELVGMPMLGFGPRDFDDARGRLTKFAEWTKTTAPKEMLDEDGAPKDELLDYCRKENLSLDWLFTGDEKGLVLVLRSQRERAA